MGEIAEAMLDGTLCIETGEYLGEAVGYPRRSTRHDLPQGSRQERRDQWTQKLRDAGFTFTVHNGGEHLRIATNDGAVDYWPSSGKWRPSKAGAETRKGFGRLVRYLRKAEPNRPEEGRRWCPHARVDADEDVECADAQSCRDHGCGWQEMQAEGGDDVG